MSLPVGEQQFHRLPGDVRLFLEIGRAVQDTDSQLCQTALAQSHFLTGVQHPDVPPADLNLPLKVAGVKQVDLEVQVRPQQVDTRSMHLLLEDTEYPMLVLVTSALGSERVQHYLHHVFRETQSAVQKRVQGQGGEGKTPVLQESRTYREGRGILVPRLHGPQSFSRGTGVLSSRQVQSHGRAQHRTVWIPGVQSVSFHPRAVYLDYYASRLVIQVMLYPMFYLWQLCLIAVYLPIPPRRHQHAYQQPAYHYNRQDVDHPKSGPSLHRVQPREQEHPDVPATKGDRRANCSSWRPPRTVRDSSILRHSRARRRNRPDRPFLPPVRGIQRDQPEHRVPLHSLLHVHSLRGRCHRQYRAPQTRRLGLDRPHRLLRPVLGGQDIPCVQERRRGGGQCRGVL